MPSFIEHGPDIPAEVLQSHEDGNLIFFCGAGVSKNAGLPLFNGLVDEIYHRLHAEKSPLEDTAFKDGDYDRVLTLLERRVDPKLVRGAIATIFDEVFNGNLEAHTNVLALSKTDEGSHRLVTTNFDDLFNKAGVTDDYTDSAPRLPNPRKKSWRSVVHIHGRLKDHADYDFENLVLNTEDFGQAYMLDGWATKFIVDLFRRFDVVFVGYSLNDPVMRYMMDALAAARSQGEGFKNSYAFVSTQPDTYQDVIEEWKTRDVIAIPYGETGNHNRLYDTLQEWAKLHSEGLISKRMIALRHADAPPADTEDPIAKLVTWALSDPSGKVAQAFAETTPVPPLGWLEHIEKAGLLGLTERSKVGHNITNVLVSPMAGVEAISLSKPTFQIARWLAAQIGERKFIKWVISKGTVLHPNMRMLIYAELERREKIPDEKIPADIHEFWNIITSEAFTSLLNRRIFGQFYSERLGGEVKAADNRRLVELLRLVPEISVYDFVWNDVFPDTEEGVDKEDDKEQSQIWRILDVELKFLSNDASSIIVDNVQSNEALSVGLLSGLTNNLIEGWEWLLAFRSVEPNEDNSYWDMASISPHDQNNGYKDWTKIVEILRDGIVLLAKQDFLKAKGIVEFWRSVDLPIFHRLFLFCLTDIDGLLEATDLRAYFERSPHLISSHSANRELLRFFRKKGALLDDGTLAFLCDEIGQGLNREDYSGMEDEEWADMNERHVCVRLAKLKIGEARLPEHAEARLNSYAASHPDVLSTNVRNEFSTWSSEGPFEWDRPLYTLDDVRSKTGAEIIQLLSEAIANREENKRADPCSVVTDIAKEQPSKAVRMLLELGKSGTCIPQILSRALSGFENPDQRKVKRSHWRYAGKALSQLPDDCLVQEARSVTDWLRNATPEYVGDITPDTWWALWDRLWAMELNNPDAEGVQDGVERWVGAAINRPAGILTEVLLSNLWSLKLETGSGLPDEYASRFNVMMSGDSYACQLARVILASRLSQLFQLEATWVTETLIPLMQWGAKPETPGLWQGYLWGARLWPDLLLALKAALLSALEQSSAVGDQSGRNLRRLFAFACIEMPRGFSDDEIQSALRTFSSDELSSVARALDNHLQNAGDTAGDQWQKRVKPFIENHWPLDEGHKSATVTNSFAGMALKTGEMFPDAVRTLTPYLARVNEGDMLPYYFKKDYAQHIQDFPETVLELLFRTAPEQRHAIYGLREVLDQILERQPDFAQDPRYQHLDRVA